MLTITFDYLCAARRWQEVCPSQVLFETFIGLRAKQLPKSGYAPITDEEVARRVQMIIGPHGETIIKAWLIRQGEATCR